MAWPWSTRSLEGLLWSDRNLEGVVSQTGRIESRGWRWQAAVGVDAGAPTRRSCWYTHRLLGLLPYGSRGHYDDSNKHSIREVR